MCTHCIFQLMVAVTGHPQAGNSVDNLSKDAYAPNGSTAPLN